MHAYRALLVAASLLGSMTAASTVPAAGASIRIGVLAYLGAEHSLEDWAPTVGAIEAALAGTRIEVIPLDHDGLARAVGEASVDFVLTNPGHYIEMEVAHGISRIATRESDAPVASAVIVRADRSDLRDLRDLTGKRLAIVGRSAFGGFQVAWREFLDVGIDPERDVALVVAGLPMTRVIDAVVGQAVDAGVVRGCLVEQREADGMLARGAVRVLASQPSSLTPCAISSRVYPDWPFAKTRHTSAELAKKVTTALLTYMPPPGGSGWTVPVDYQPVHDLFRALMIGPYEGLRHGSLADLLRRYWPWLALAVLALAAWVVHVFRVERLVNRRTTELAVVNGELRHEIAARRAVEEREALHRRELDHAARLSIVGEMASGLAHELNQPLAAITNYADGSEMRLRAGRIDADALIEATRRIRQQAQRAAQVIQRMRAFVRKREPVHVRLDVDEVVAETVELFEGPARRVGVAIEVVTGPGAPTVLADRVQLQQVLLNLLQNAVDATRDQAGGARTVEVATSACGGGAGVVVADRGTGIPPQVRPRLFEPFFTTKPDGLGLGLALCRSIIDEHRGRLTAEDNPGGGTAMRLWLPAADHEGAPHG